MVSDVPLRRNQGRIQGSARYSCPHPQPTLYSLRTLGDVTREADRARRSRDRALCLTIVTDIDSRAMHERPETKLAYGRHALDPLRRVPWLVRRGGEPAHSVVRPKLGRPNSRWLRRPGRRFPRAARCEIHIPISPTPPFLTRIHYLAAVDPTLRGSARRQSHHRHGWRGRAHRPCESSTRGRSVWASSGAGSMILYGADTASSPPRCSGSATTSKRRTRCCSTPTRCSSGRSTTCSIPWSEVPRSLG